LSRASATTESIESTLRSANRHPRSQLADGGSARKSSLRPNSLLEADALPDAVATSSAGALSRAAKRVRIAPTGGGGVQEDMDEDELLAELQAEMLALD